MSDVPLVPVPLTDLQSQNPMMEICFNEKDHVVCFVKNIERVETDSTYSGISYSFHLKIFYRDGKNTTFTWSKGAERDIGYQKLMNVIRACYPVLKV